MTARTGGSTTSDAQNAVLEVLVDAYEPLGVDVRGTDMPPELERRYGGPLRIPLRGDRPTVVANFVSTLDGIVAMGGGDLAGGGLVSGFHEPDRFVMGLLRALADVVVVGAGTVRGSSAHAWVAEHVHPASAPGFRAWRRDMGLAERPTTMIVSGSGDLPVDHAGLLDPTIPVVIATTAAGASRLRRTKLGEHASIEVPGTGDTLTGNDVVALGAGLGARLILTEGGPHLLGEFLESGALDEVFLTLAPQLVGRGGDDRLGLVEGHAFAPSDARWNELLSVRRSVDHLFLRYRAKES